MKIGFDVSQIGKNKAGCGFFADGLIHALTKVIPQHDYVLYPSFGEFYFSREISQSSQIKGRGTTYGPRHKTFAETAAFWKVADLDSHLGGIDILHSNNYWCPRQLRSTRLIYTLYDLSFLEEPSWTTEANRNGCFHGVFGAATAADWIIAISNASREHFLRIFPSFPTERVDVVYPASRFDEVDNAGTRPKSVSEAQAGNYWLCVATIEPRKNHERLLQAFARYLGAGGRPMPLVLAGGNGWLMEEFAARIAKLGLTDQVILTGYVTDEELRWLYKNCYAHVYVSLFEGFGLPVLEGMQLGVPTIASRSTSIPEISGEATILVDPMDVEGITHALVQIGKNGELRRSLSDRARRQAREFQWERSAKQLAELYQLACDAPKRQPVNTS
jgi:glycosyltransferase involved in cell wall biosynthesis